ncbi:Uu.00g082770.m01.CDS01 [Anthostomella pinea]|uniref:Uu.00g082770.m01.CDS01 n=1 Tax=Anthostomella pinea TaxID=933095 RepID=A0AAI8VMD2_9PEZI|nr:Uu.00g082770.m01.CDS01 [Anthostomella pinea]
MATTTSTASSVPSTYRALVLNSTRDPYDISVVQKNQLQAGPGSAVVQILVASVLTYAGRVYSGRKPYPYPEPFVPGSSAIGRLVAAGADATLLKPGQLVYIDTFIEGRDDRTSLILHGLSSGFSPGSKVLMKGEWRDGTYAEYSKLPLENCFPLDEARLLGSPAHGGLGYKIEDLMYLWPLSVPFGGLRDVGLHAGEKVIITPATGSFGGAAVLAALAMGGRVVAVSRDMESLERLKVFSPEGRITTVQNTGDVETDVKKLTQDGPADVFFDISPGKAASSAHFKSCVRALGRGGRVSLMGYHDQLPLPMPFVVLNDLTIKGKWMYTKEDLRVMIKMVETGFLKLGEAGGIKTVGSFPLEEFAAAFEQAADHGGPGLQTVIAP